MADLDLMTLLSMLSSQAPRQQQSMARPEQVVAPLSNAAPSFGQRGQPVNVIPYMPGYPGANSPADNAALLAAYMNKGNGGGGGLGGGKGGGSGSGLLSGSGGKLSNMIGSSGDGSGAAFGTGAPSGLMGMFSGAGAGAGAGMSAMDISSAVGSAY